MKFLSVSNAPVVMIVVFSATPVHSIAKNAETQAVSLTFTLITNAWFDARLGCGVMLKIIHVKPANRNVHHVLIIIQTPVIPAPLSMALIITSNTPPQYAQLYAPMANTET